MDNLRFAAAVNRLLPSEHVPYACMRSPFWQFTVATHVGQAVVCPRQACFDRQQQFQGVKANIPQNKTAKLQTDVSSKPRH